MWELMYCSDMFRHLPEVPVRKFNIELKHRPDGDDGSNEQLIETLILSVPRLRNSDMEKQWVLAQLWDKLFEPEYKAKNINQVFIFTAGYAELLGRLEVAPFTDEPAVKIEPPNPKQFKNWQSRVDRQFKNLYGFSINQWQEANPP